MLKSNSCTIYLPIIFLMFSAVFFAYSPCQAEDFTVMEYCTHYPPVFFRENEQPKGIVPDVLAAIGDITGDTFTYVRAPFPRAQLMFETGEIDIEASVNPHWREKAQVPGVFTIPYGESVNVFLFPDKKSAFEISSLEDLKGKRFGSVRGFEYAELNEFFSNGRLDEVKCPDEDKLLQLLAERRIDVTIIHKPLVQYRMKTTPEYRDFVIGKPFIQDDIMMRFIPSKSYAVPRFNKAIRQLINSGKINEIQAKYR